MRGVVGSIQLHVVAVEDQAARPVDVFEERRERRWPILRRERGHSQQQEAEHEPVNATHTRAESHLAASKRTRSMTQSPPVRRALSVVRLLVRSRWLSSVNTW